MSDRELPNEHCQNGRWDICLAGAIDGICCSEDECDIDDGVRHAEIARQSREDK